MRRSAQTLCLLLLLAVAASCIPYGCARRDERRIISPNGTPRLAGPLASSGPTYGASDQADLEITDFGWNHYNSPPFPRNYTKPFAAVRNKSQRTWQNVAVQIHLVGRDRSVSQVAIPIGTLKPGENRQGEGPEVSPNVAYSSVIGVSGQE